MTVQLCVLLWARPGAGEALTAYEDKVLALLGSYDGRLVQRASTAGEAGSGAGGAAAGGAAQAPTEIQLIEFTSQDGYDGFLADPRRAAMAGERDAAIARTEIYPVTFL